MNRKAALTVLGIGLAVFASQTNFSSAARQQAGFTDYNWTRHLRADYNWTRHLRADFTGQRVLAEYNWGKSFSID